MKTIFNILLCPFLALLIVACQPSEERPEPADSLTYFDILIEDIPIQLQLALKEHERQKGLMHRDQLGEDQGMLFLFDQPSSQGFWMKNTRIPLDLGYFDASGRLLEIHKLFPYDENEVNSISDRILIAIETNRGWFQANGISPGAQIDINSLLSALQRRGHTNNAIQD